jgi:predicted enzyme related to lactoylglutathione lyase
MSHHLIAHVEIPATDLVRSQNFFTEVFGWDLKEFGNGYLLCNSRQGTTIGIRKVKEVTVGDSPVFHILVDDIEDALKLVKKSGGSIFKDKTVIPVYGWYAVMQDQDGNKIGLYQAH